MNPRGRRVTRIVGGSALAFAVCSALLNGYRADPAAALGFTLVFALFAYFEARGILDRTPGKGTLSDLFWGIIRYDRRAPLASKARTASLWIGMIWLCLHFFFGV